MRANIMLMTEISINISKCKNTTGKSESALFLLIALKTIEDDQKHFKLKFINDNDNDNKIDLFRHQ